MALDTSALSPQRKAVSLFVLLILFVGSLGLAHVLISRRTGAPVEMPTLPREQLQMRMSISTAWPRGFTIATSERAGDEVLEIRRGTVNGGTRTLAVFMTTVSPDESLDEIAEAILREQFPDGRILAQRSVLGTRLPAQDFVALPPEGEGAFARLRAVLEQDRFVGVLYAGDSPWTDQDTANFEVTAGRNFQLRMSNPRPANAPEGESDAPALKAL